jgi:hypothetical protein
MDGWIYRQAFKELIPFNFMGQVGGMNGAANKKMSAR